MVVENPDLVKIIDHHRKLDFFTDDEFELIKDRDCLGPFSGWCLLMSRYYPTFNEDTAKVIIRELESFDREHGIILKSPDIHALSYYATANDLATRYTNNQAQDLLKWQFSRLRGQLRP